MNDAPAQTGTVLLERELPHAPEKIWRALTQPHLLSEWLMKTDFMPEVGHCCSFGAEWGSVDCRVLKVEPNRSLSYSWGDHDLKSVVTWTLTPTDTGTNLRLEQTGFQPDQPRYFHGARAGWPRFLARLEQLLEGMD